MSGKLYPPTPHFRLPDEQLNDTIRLLMLDHVAKEEPSDKVWERIQAGLEGGPLAYPREEACRSARWYLNMSLIAAAFLVVLGLVMNSNHLTWQSRFDNGAIRSIGYPESSVPIKIPSDDALSSRHVSQIHREKTVILRGLNPSTDPVLIHRR